MSVRFEATGHPAVISTHPTTIEITRQTHLSTRGDCIVAVNATIGPSDLPRGLKDHLSSHGSKAQLSLMIDGLSFVVEGKGDPRLTLSHQTDFVIRKSGFISDRTVMVHADKSALDLPREMVRLLRDPEKRIIIEIFAESLL